MRRLPYQCYEMWNRCERCENCISAKCFHQKGKLEKFEFIENETYHVVAMYMEIDGVPYSLEMLNKSAPSDQVIKLKSIEAMQKVADGKATKIIIPSEIQNVAGLVKSVSEIAKDTVE